MSFAFKSLAAESVAVSQRLTANSNTTGVDLSRFKGGMLFSLNASATAGAGQTADFKLQHSDTQGGTYTDTGLAFAQVTNAGASQQQVMASPRSLKKFVRVAATLGGTSPVVQYGVSVIGQKVKG